MTSNTKATRQALPTTGSPARRPSRNNPTSPGQQGLFPAPASARDQERAQQQADRLEWLTQARQVAWQLIQQGDPFDAHRITEIIGRPFPGDGRALAKVIRWHTSREHLELWGYHRTRRPTSGAVVASWLPTRKGRLAALYALHPHLGRDAGQAA